VIRDGIRAEVPAMKNMSWNDRSLILRAEDQLEAMMTVHIVFSNLMTLSAEVLSIVFTIAAVVF